MDAIQWAVVVLIILIGGTVYSLTQCVNSLQQLVLLNDEKLMELERKLERRVHDGT